jgi:hypothetical protein
MTYFPHRQSPLNRLKLVAPIAMMTTAVACSNEVKDEPAPTTGTAQQAVSGNIHPDEIQIDGGGDGADLRHDVGVPLNAGAALDWVADSAPNSGTGCLSSDGLASCIETGVTGATGGVGHWNGVRIVDGIGGADQDIFLTGGKENKHETWNIGPGSVGSSKYDITQAYLANNQSSLYFGMERRGNNGTTAFDFEFNQLAPMADPSCPQDPAVPCRTVGDVLFTFEMKGSGGSGTATPYTYTWDGTTFVAGSAAGIVSSINSVQTTAGPPWGHVDSKGNWVLGDLKRFAFAEAVAPISLLPGIDNCGGKAFVQVRTRSSSVVNSDLKDTTKVFEFVFNSIAAQAVLTPSCDQGFNYSASAVDGDGNTITNPVCSWSFDNGASSSSCSGFIAAAPGTYVGTVTISDPNTPGCEEDATSGSVEVHPPIAVTATVGGTCSSAISYDATVSGGSGSASFGWTFSGGGTVSPSSSSSKSGTVAVGTGAVSYSGSVTVTDGRSDIQCTATDDDSATPFDPLAVSLTLSGAAQTCPSMTTDAVTYTAVVSGGDGSYGYGWSNGTCNGVSCAIDPDATNYCHDGTLSVQVTDGSGLCGAADSETESYSKVTIITASDH